MFPFIYPIIASSLVNLGILNNMEEIKLYIEIFKPFYILTVIILIGLILYGADFSIPDALHKLALNFNLKFKKGDTQIELSPKTSESQKKKLIQQNEKIKKEVQETLNNHLNKKDFIDKCSECKLEEITSERDSLRFFSAYQVTNKFSRDLLRAIKENGKITKEIFIYNINNYYQNSIRNMGKKRKEQFISQKIEELLYNLRYLNIIEYTEDDNYIILTEDGKNFVNDYYVEEVG